MKVAPQFTQVKHKASLDYNAKPLDHEIEGYVYYLDDQYMIKAKTDWYVEARQKTTN